MKSHLVVTLRRSVPEMDAPYWVDMISDKTAARESLVPAVDRLLAERGLPVWVAHEYRQAGGAWTAEEIAAGLDRIYRLILQRDARFPPDLVHDISLVPLVESVRPGVIGDAPMPTPRATQMSVTTDIESRQAIHLPEAHRITRGEPEVVVAVLDTGICATHPELRHSLLPGFDFVDILDGHEDFVGDFLSADADPNDEVGHGTHVAGIIVGKGAAMPAGVVPRCRVLPVRTLGAMRQGDRLVGAGLVDNINNGVKWAVDQGAHIINMSLGVRHEGGGLPHAEVVEYARRKGVTIVAAAGNDGQHALYYPGALPHVMAVGAFDAGGAVATFSTYGDHIALIGPGELIYSSYLDDDYAFSTGTSQAAPFVAGAAAMLKAHARAVSGVVLSDARLKHILRHTADRVDGRFRHRRAGYGKLNLVDALSLLEHRLGARRETLRPAVAA